MKKTLIGLSIALLAALWISGSWVFFNAVSLRDQDGDCSALADRGHDSQAAPGDRGLHHGFLELLNLSQDQKKQMSSIRGRELAKMRPLFQSLRIGREHLLALVRSGRFDEAQARAVANGQAVFITDLIVAKARMRSKIYALLTPEQRNKLQDLHDSSNSFQMGESAR